ncbi:pseudouridine synthase [Bryobacter aggregatus]|uniref:pseudouridine synthase n=1 Tax=Bryobacter aggregatus TaxID=360054 RepID=UPI0009B5A925|nr:pseudouridine synthase [Bryobacter aggregatus]
MDRPIKKTTKSPITSKTLERVISKAGLGSRTDARHWIHSRRVTVNGRMVENPDEWIDPIQDRIELDGRLVKTLDKLYILLYKPAGYITSKGDPEGRKTVYDLLTDVPSFVGTVGRLDEDTSGLLLLTNDTALAERMTNPEFHVPKTYLVKCSTKLSDEALETLRQGVELKDGMTRPAIVNRVRENESKSFVELTITEGKNRQVRRMIEAMDSQVLKLVRTNLGPLTLTGLESGKWRHLNPGEVTKLMKLAGMEEKPVRKETEAAPDAQGGMRPPSRTQFGRSKPVESDWSAKSPSRDRSDRAPRGGDSRSDSQWSPKKSTWNPKPRTGSKAEWAPRGDDAPRGDSNWSPKPKSDWGAKPPSRGKAEWSPRGGDASRGDSNWSPKPKSDWGAKPPSRGKSDWAPRGGDAPRGDSNWSPKPKSDWGAKPPSRGKSDWAPRGGDAPRGDSNWSPKPKSDWGAKPPSRGKSDWAPRGGDAPRGDSNWSPKPKSDWGAKPPSRGKSDWAPRGGDDSRSGSNWSPKPKSDWGAKPPSRGKSDWAPRGGDDSRGGSNWSPKPKSDWGSKPPARGKAEWSPRGGDDSRSGSNWSPKPKSDWGAKPPSRGKSDWAPRGGDAPRGDSKWSPKPKSDWSAKPPSRGDWGPKTSFRPQAESHSKPPFKGPSKGVGDRRFTRRRDQ